MGGNNYNTSEPVAIVGVGCRFPGARDLKAFEQLLFDGQCAIGELPADRLDQTHYYDPEPGAYGKSYSRLGGIVEDAPFDHEAFGLPSAVARSRDRAHLWALEVAADTFAHSGIAPDSVRGTRTAVILGHARGSLTTVDVAFATAAEELLLALDTIPALSELSPESRALIRARALEHIRAEDLEAGDGFGPGPTTSAMAGLIGRVFGLTGRHMLVDAACASSLAAMAIACRALRNRTADRVLAGGVSFSQEPSVILFAQSRALSARGSFPFDARADGFISSDGLGMVLLERLSDALTAGRRIYGLLRGLGASCDGKGKGMWAPRREGQVLAIERALASAGVDPSEVGYVEAHGTSTMLGDATEVAALSEVFSPRLPPGTRLPIGSVKGNIGHTREAAGIAGLIKALIALETGRIPPSIGFENPSPDIPWAEIPFEVVRETRPWPNSERPRIAVVNSFGIGGINYEAIVEEAPRPPQPRDRQVGSSGADGDGTVTSAASVAVVGLGALFPDARSARELWQRLCAKHRAIREVSPERWSPEVFYESDGASRFRTASKHGAFLDDYRPDWRRYRLPPALVESNDPLQFMLLDAATEALEDAGIDVTAIDRQRVGVVVGTQFGSDYALALTLAIRVPELTDAVADVLEDSSLSPEERRRALRELETSVRARLPRISEDSSGSFSASTLASRIAKTLDLNGLAFAVDASSASSLASLEVACEILDSGECDLVLCGGGDRSMRVQRFIAESRAGALSTNEVYRPFGEPSGHHLGEGAGILVLMRLGDALAEDRRVYATVRGVGSASDGELLEIRRCSARGLEQAMRDAHLASGCGPAEVGAVELHAAAESESDAVELEALTRTGYLDARKAPLLVGSVKSNIGHCQGAAGAASLVKAALGLAHRVWPPTAGLDGAEPELGEAIELTTELAPLAGASRAAVTTIGAGGIYYHALLESGPAGCPCRIDGAGEPLVLCAPSRPALVAAIDRLTADADSIPEPGTTLGRGSWRLAVQAGEGLQERLSRARSLLRSGRLAGTDPAALSQGLAFSQGPMERNLCLMFSGQGSQYPGMLREIATIYPEAAELLGEIDRILVEIERPKISRVMWSDEDALSGVLSTQLAVLAGDLMMLAVARAHGLEPALVTGHSYGDYPALVAAGGLSLEDAVHLTIARCEAIENFAAAGGMAAMFVDYHRAEELLRDLPGAAFASNINSRDQFTVSAEPAALDALIERSARAGIECRRLAVPAPFHSPLMASVVDHFRKAIAQVELREPSLPFVSSVGGRRLRAPEDLERALTEQLTEPVDFVSQIEGLHADGIRRFLEIGPSSTLSRLTASILEGRPAVVVSLDNRKAPGAAAVQRALLALRASEHDEALTKCPETGVLGEPDDPLFSTEEWQVLRAHPRWETFWPSTRSAVRLLVQGLIDPGAEQATRSPLGATVPGAVSFHDATEARLQQPTEHLDEMDRQVDSTRVEAATPGKPTDLAGDVRGYLLEQVIERTGYPPDLVQFDLDMEADLGIDTVKQAQIFGAMRERFDLRTEDTLSLRDFPTLQHVLEYVVSLLAVRPREEPEAPSTDEAVGMAAPDEPDSESVSQPRKARPQGAELLRLTGSPLEMGLEHGRRLREELSVILEEYEVFLGEDGARKSELQEALGAPERFFDEVSLEEIEGLAEGSGLPYRHLLAYNLDSALFPEYAVGCVQLGLVQESQGDGGPAARVIHAFNEDSPLSLLLRAKIRSILQVRTPETGHAHVLSAQPGRVGGVCGLNAAGLVITSSVLLDRSQPGGHREALLHPLLIRRMLQDCSTTGEAVDLARAARRGGAWSILMSHAREKTLRRFDYDGDRTLACAEVERHVVSNHSLSDAGPDVPEHSIHRLSRLRQLLERDGNLGAPEIREMLRDRFDAGRGREVAHRTMNTVHRVDNVAGLVVEPARGLLSFAVDEHAGNGETAWQEIRFDELFRAAACPETTRLHELDAADLPEIRRTSPQPPLMTRYVLRTEKEPLAESVATYRPERLAILGGGRPAEALARAMRERGTSVEMMPLDSEPDALASSLEKLTARGAYPDLCLLAALDRAGGSEGQALDGLARSWPELRVRQLEGPYAAIRSWVRRLPRDRPVTLSAVTAMGGLLGTANFGASLPEGGAVMGLLKALRLETSTVRVKVLDIEPSESPDSVARALLGELDSKSGRLEVGFFRGQRRILRMVPAPVRIDPSSWEGLPRTRPFLLTGGGRGITARLAVRLAALGVERFHLLGRARLDPRVEEWRELDAEGREHLRQELLTALRRKGRVTPLDWKRALEPVDKAIEIDATLRALRQLGTEADYHSVDVSDAESLEAVLSSIRDKSGPIEAIVHGAGVERSSALVSKSIGELRSTLGAKVDGALNLIALTRSDPLRLFVSFSSVSGRFGGPGQTDYSMASEMLARVTAVLAQERPECRAFTIAWPAWDEVGMAVRETIRERLVESGQKLMPVAEGCDHFLAELASTDLEPEVTFAERLDAIDVDRLLPGEEESRELAKTRKAAERLPLVDGILASAPGNVVSECRLDGTRDVFLTDHRMGPHPILPAVVGLEILAETASLVAPGSSLLLSEVTIETPLKLKPDERLALRCRASASTDGVGLRLEVDPVGPKGRLLETDRLLLHGTAMPNEPLEEGVVAGAPETSYRRVEIAYPKAWSSDSRARSMYHGPALRGLTAVHVSEGEHHRAEIVAPASGALRPGRPDGWLLPAAALDNCLQACGVVSRARLGVVALPAHFGRVRVGRAPAPGERCQAHITLLGRSDTEARFDVALVGHDGALLVLLEEYRAKILDGERIEGLARGRS